MAASLQATSHGAELLGPNFGCNVGVGDPIGEGALGSPLNGQRDDYQPQHTGATINSLRSVMQLHCNGRKNRSFFCCWNKRTPFWFSSWGVDSIWRWE